MTEKALKASEIIDYADHTRACWRRRPGQLNPYKLGIELLRDIEERWNKGQLRQGVGRVQTSTDAGATGTSALGLGRKKIFEVRKLYNDVTFIDEFFTAEFCQRAEVLLVRLQRAQRQLGDRLAASSRR